MKKVDNSKKIRFQNLKFQKATALELNVFLWFHINQNFNVKSHNSSVEPKAEMHNVSDLNHTSNSSISLFEQTNSI